MELTFMTGGMVFFAVKLFAAVLFAKLVYDMLVHKKFQVWRIFGLVSLSIILAPSVIRPKQEIVVPTTIEQKQYQTNDEELVIETPEPRTQSLEGFKPMGEN